MREIALLGGEPLLKKPLASYVSMGEREADAEADIVRSGCLSEIVRASCR